jgi:hypothetical protein
MVVTHPCKTASARTYRCTHPINSKQVSFPPFKTTLHKKHAVNQSHYCIVNPMYKAVSRTILQSSVSPPAGACGTGKLFSPSLTAFSMPTPVAPPHDLRVKSIGYTGSYLACRIGHGPDLAVTGSGWRTTPRVLFGMQYRTLVPIWQTPAVAGTPPHATALTGWPSVARSAMRFQPW